MKNLKIKLIIFDAYGVCLKGGYPDTCKFLAKKFKKNWRELYSIIYTKYFNRAALKKISQSQAWAMAIKELDLPISIEDLKKIHYGFMSINKPVLKLVKILRKKYRVLLLSKSTRVQFKDINNRLPQLRKTFGNAIINTWEHNLPKASKETIKFICRKYKIEPQEIVYIDNQQENLMEPRQLGVKTIFYKNFNQFKKNLAKYLKD